MSKCRSEIVVEEALAELFDIDLFAKGSGGKGGVPSGAAPLGARPTFSPETTKLELILLS